MFCLFLCALPAFVAPRVAAPAQRDGQPCLCIRCCAVFFLWLGRGRFALQAWWRMQMSRAQTIVLKQEVHLVQRFWLLNHARSFYMVVLNAVRACVVEMLWLTGCAGFQPDVPYVDCIFFFSWISYNHMTDAPLCWLRLLGCTFTQGETHCRGVQERPAADHGAELGAGRVTGCRVGRRCHSAKAVGASGGPLPSRRRAFV